MDNFLDPRKRPTQPQPKPAAKIRYDDSSVRRDQDDDIASVWDEQKRIRAQDKLLEIEYEIAKEKARRLKEQIKKNQIGDETIFGDDLKKYMPGYHPVAKNSLKLAQKALERTSAKALALKQQAKVKIVVPVPRQQVQPQPAAEQIPPAPAAKRRGKKPLLTLATVLIMAGMGAGGYAAYTRQQKPDTKTAVLSSLVNDSAAVDDMLFPSSFPDGYSEQRVSAERPEDAKDVYILTMSHASDTAKSIFISQQALPKDFNINEFNDTLEGAEEFAVSAGRATYGQIPADNTHVVSIVGQRQWILINALSSVSADDLRLVAAGLTK